MTGESVPGDQRSRRHHPLVFVADVERPELDESDDHHLRRSLRVRPGQTITISDGAGRWRFAAFDRRPDPTTEVFSEPLGRRWGVGFALVKGDRPELVVQKLTELGASIIVPLTTERTVVRWDETKAERNRERHLRIAREAAMQSRRVRLPTVEIVMGLKEVYDRFPRARMAEPGVPRPVPETSSADPVMILIGPEGGFSPQELEGRPVLSLPGGILRTETAAIAAGVVLATLADLPQSASTDTAGG